MLKIRNNSSANLKSTLKVLQEKQNGSKEGLLLRLAKKLATEAGQNMARKAFKPEIYHEIYDIDLFSSFDRTNEVYNFYQGLVPNNLKCSGKLAVIGNTGTPMNKYHHNLQRKQPQPASISQQKVIEINDDDEDINDFSDTAFQSPLKSKYRMENLTVENIYQNISMPKCLLDKDVPSEERKCYCDPMEAELCPNKDTIKCKTCQHISHSECQELNKKMRQSRIDQKLEFNCDHCQFMALDPLAIPVATIMSPFKISKIKNDQAKQQILGGCIDSCSHEFYVKQEFLRMIKSYGGSFSIQVRSIRLDGMGFEHCFPKYGFLQINNAQCQREFKIPDPPNHEKKRKDSILDITRMCKFERNFINIFQIQKNYKNMYVDHPGHIVGIFLVKNIQPQDLINFISVKKIENPDVSLIRFNSFFNSIQCLDKDVQMIESQQTDKAILTLFDPMTILPINIPVRGEICQHLTCFDLQTYVTMNSQSKRWQCPYCNKRCSFLKVDSFFKIILDQRKTLSEETQTEDIDYKVTLDQDLSITFTRNKGKAAFKKYQAIIKDGACVGFEGSIEEREKSQEETKNTCQISSEKENGHGSQFNQPMTKIISDFPPASKTTILGKRKHTDDPIENYLIQKTTQVQSSQEEENTESCEQEPIEIE